MTSTSPLCRHAHAMPFGAAAHAAGGIEFRLWAPGARSVELVLVDDSAGERLLPVAAGEHSWHALFVPGAAAGWRYRWRIDGHLQVPDPASRFNPDGPHGFSEVVEPRSFDWGLDAAWRGRPWHEAVLYEMHVGTFTTEGTYAAAQQHLKALAEMGVTALQLMPLADFPGRFGWGYDGVLPFAPHAPYGRPDDLKRFVQAAHAQGLMVMLDVVYNHFGPDGNYLPAYAPAFFSDKHHTAWGAAVNFDGPGSDVVREFFIHNALFWLGEYRFDGLRFDAVHAMLDDSTPDIMASISERVRAAFPERHVHLVLENDSNDARRLAPPGTAGRFEGQWNGDFHHPLHVLLTGERDGYYAEYVDDTFGQLLRSLTHGLVWQGGPHNSEHAPPRRRADSSVPLGAMVNFLQNHDQVGNRAFGERLLSLAGEQGEAPMALLTAVFLLNPATPMLFMGEEFGATTPFLYFCDWQGDLKQAVTEGRRKEFAQFPRFADPQVREHIPDPCAVDTFQRSRLDRAQAESPAGRRWRDLHTRLLHLRRDQLTPRLPALQAGGHEAARCGARATCVRWRFDGGLALQAVLNFSAEPVTDVPPGWLDADADASVWWQTGEIDARRLGPWSGRWVWTRPHGDNQKDDKDERTQSA